MTHTLLRLAFLALALGFGGKGCKGCGTDGDGSRSRGATGTERQAQTNHASVMSRLSARKLDREKQYPKDDQGVTLCGTDVDCFIMQAERCAPASFNHLQELTAYGLTRRVEARYTFAGRSADRCKVRREVIAIAAEIDKTMAKALLERGHTESDLKNMESAAIAELIKQFPAGVECSFSDDDAIESALDLADGRYDPRRWTRRCDVTDAAAPRVGVDAPEAPAGGGDGGTAAQPAQ
jgi:hypothetical protein